MADVYDALISRSVYKEALGLMRKEKGVHFDPDVLDCMLNIVKINFTSGANDATEEYEPHKTMDRCPLCGIALNENGVCPKCGYKKNNLNRYETS